MITIDANDQYCCAAGNIGVPYGELNNMEDEGIVKDGYRNLHSDGGSTSGSGDQQLADYWIAKARSTKQVMAGRKVRQASVEGWVNIAIAETRPTHNDRCAESSELTERIRTSSPGESRNSCSSTKGIPAANNATPLSHT